MMGVGYEVFPINHGGDEKEIATARIRNDFFFFFSSRRRHTRLQGDWSSDVCSSDLCRSTKSWMPAPMTKAFVAGIHDFVDRHGLDPKQACSCSLVVVRVDDRAGCEIGRASCRERV